MKKIMPNEDFNYIIAIKEMSAGNASVGDMWLETNRFHKSQSIHEIIEWGKNCSGKLILTIDESDIRTIK